MAYQIEQSWKRFIGDRIHATLFGEQEDSDGTWLIELAVDSRYDPSMEDKQVYVQVAKRNNTFFVNNIQENLPAGCQGETLPALRDGRELPSW